MIRAADRIASVIARDETLVDAFVAVSPVFERLRNPAMRKVMGRLVTVEQAARVAGVDPDVLLEKLNAHAAATAVAGDAGGVGGGSAAVAGPAAVQHARPQIVSDAPASKIVMADVRDELRAGREPFSLIMSARASVPDGGVLCVRAIFEPVPLYAVMQRQGMQHWTEKHADDDWVVWFYATPSAAPADAGGSVHASADGSLSAHDGDVVVIDVRGMEPPEPMMRTLAALEQLPAGSTLVQINVRVPQFLLPMLAERGFSYEIREQDADVVRLFIRRDDAATPRRDVTAT